MGFCGILCNIPRMWDVDLNKSWSQWHSVNNTTSLYNVFYFNPSGGMARFTQDNDWLLSSWGHSQWFVTVRSFTTHYMSLSTHHFGIEWKSCSKPLTFLQSQYDVCVYSIISHYSSHCQLNKYSITTWFWCEHRPPTELIDSYCRQWWCLDHDAKCFDLFQA